MANTKISAFTAETDVANITGFAAYKTVSGTSTNVRISGSEIESTLNLSNFAVGTLAVGRGGTGQTSYTDGQLLIGNTTGNTLAKATLTQGTDLSITNGNGSITIGHATVSNTPATNSTTLSAGGTFTAINSVTVSAQGHLTAQNTETYTLPSDSDTTYAISAADGDNTDEEKIVLTAGGSGSGTSTIVLEASTGLTIARSSDKITFTNSAPNQATPAAGTSAGEIQYNNGSNAFAAVDTFKYNNRILSVGKVGDTARSHLKIYGGDDGGGNDQDAHLTLYCSAGTHGVTIEGPDHTGGSNYTLKLPASLPNVANQILESNASGALSWIATPTDTSIYSADGSLSAARTVTMGGNNLTFASSGGLFTIQKNLKVEGQSYGDITSVSNATVDWDNGNIQSITLPSGASTYTPTNPQAGATYILKIIQPSTGDGTITWGSSVKWPGATAPILTASNAAVDVVTLIYDGTNYLATSVLNLS